ncbi:hypothetical protein K1719_015111 [Acacia pycnantha]|nr:hypothetical protein K1719_015111 [Acacia pycnantha]
MLKVMADSRGRTIILSIHQPGFRIVELFSSILLLANGCVLHHGNVELLSVNMRLIGLDPPLHVNVVEFAIEYIETIQQQQKCKPVQHETPPHLPITGQQKKFEDESKSGRFTLQQLFQQSSLTDKQVIINTGIEFTCEYANSRMRETMILTHSKFSCGMFKALVPNFIVGNIVISGVIGSFFLFSGYFISKNEIPKCWIFMHYISLFKYPFEGFLINEFSDSRKCLEYVFGSCMVTGASVLKEGYGEESSRWKNVGVMVCFILFYRFISYVILRYRCSRREI